MINNTAAGGVIAWESNKPSAKKTADNMAAMLPPVTSHNIKRKMMVDRLHQGQFFIEHRKGSDYNHVDPTKRYAARVQEKRLVEDAVKIRKSSPGMNLHQALTAAKTQMQEKEQRAKEAARNKKGAKKSAKPR